jgi:DNA-binding Xre family transcriptional regulator
MLRFKIIESIKLRGYTYAFSYLVKKIGMGGGKAARYCNGKQQSISLDDLSELCRQLECTPNDLLYWQHSATHPLPPQHPIHSALQPPTSGNSWATAIQKLSPAEAAEMLALLQAKAKK